ncbi:hypothetical protein CVT24_002916 [Panaeolus cyanescens]|uniref:Uncharacterized protein n=1 Tax=Panaeolus cyanescens TaxID=181874 RepID=A0A409YRP1_9AGAR|nr:hypothetical protein CVT24_002916 [Panaeolus cyanescens]
MDAQSHNTDLPSSMELILKALHRIVFPESAMGIPTIPQSPGLVCIVNDFINLLFHNPLIKPGDRVLYAVRLLDLTDAFCSLDELVQLTRGYDQTTKPLYNKASYCMNMIGQILVLFPPNAKLSNVLQTFEEYLKDPPIRLTESAHRLTEDPNSLPRIVHVFPSLCLVDFDFQTFFDYVDAQEGERIHIEEMRKVKRVYKSDADYLWPLPGEEGYYEPVIPNGLFDNMRKNYHFY